MRTKRFQSTLPRRERQEKVTYHKWDGYFNPRSREGSDKVEAELAKENNYFNPRSREGSDRDGVSKVTVGNISIHAPAKGATSA